MPRILSRIGAGLLMLALAGCANSLDSPVRQLTRSGQDARSYNPQTGEYEWPDEPPRRRDAGWSATRAAREIEPGSSVPGDGRVYNAQTGAWGYLPR